ncbi:MAG: hypothetical protein WCT37_02875 [Patescibacteria group bacterium]|jgi:hypothetical protein
MTKIKPQPKLSEIKEDLSGVKNDLSGVKEDLEAIKSTMATMTTKRELSAFQEESEEFFVAIKKDLDNTATKDDLIVLGSGLESKIDKLGEELRTEISSTFGQILTGQDKVVKMLMDYQSEGAANTSAHKRMDESLENHGKRIGVLETKFSH